jgi:hypothetical protein
VRWILRVRLCGIHRDDRLVRLLHVYFHHDHHRAGVLRLGGKDWLRVCDPVVLVLLRSRGGGVVLGVEVSVLRNAPGFRSD